MRVQRFSLAFIAVLLSSTVARADVSLQILDSIVSGSPNSVNVGAGETFTILVNLVSTSEQTTGLNFYLEALGASSSLFTITGRNTAGSFYNDPVIFSDSDVTTNGPLLDPRNDRDLGGSVSSVRPAGTWLVGRYDITVSPSAAPGLYELHTISNPGEGYVTPGVPFDIDVPFNQHGSYSILVPEPGSLGLLSAAALLLTRRRVRR